MSDIETLQKENETLKQQAASNSQGIHGLLAQLDAYKQIFNNMNITEVSLRTNLILFEKSNKELSAANAELNKKIAELNKPIEDSKEA